MTDHPETLERHRLPLGRGQLKQAASFRPLMRYVPKNPLLLIGAALVGVAGVVAWRNRERIARTATPLIEDAKAKGQELIQDARAKSQELVQEAKARGQAVKAAIASPRQSAAEGGTTPTSELH